MKYVKVKPKHWWSLKAWKCAKVIENITNWRMKSLMEEQLTFDFLKKLRSTRVPSRKKKELRKRAKRKQP